MENEGSNRGGRKQQKNSTEIKKCCSSGASAALLPRVQPVNAAKCLISVASHTPPRQERPRNSPLPVLRVEEELELLEEEVVVMVEEELQEEAVVVHVEDVVEAAVEAGMSPSMSAALWECDRQRALMGSKPSCRENGAEPVCELTVCS